MNHCVSCVTGIVALVMVCLPPLPAFTQTTVRGRRGPLPPASCVISLASIATVAGSPSYIRLRYLIGALNIGQESVTSLARSLNEFNTATTPTLALASLLTGAQQAQDNLNCAAAMMNAYPAASDDDKRIKSLLVASFNREADIVADVTARAKKQILLPVKAQTNASQLQDAERLAARTAAQNGAATDIATATTFAVLLSFDLSDTTAKTTEYLAVDCDEYASLLKEVDPLVHGEKSAYSQSGELIKVALDGHKCRSSEIKGSLIPLR